MFAQRKPVAAVVRSYRSSLAVGLYLSACATLCPAQERLLISHAGMHAYVNGSGCSQAAALEVRSNNPADFDGARAELQRLVGGARAVLSIECPGIARITVKGTVNGQLCFAGATEKRWAWHLKGLFALPAGQ